MINQLTTQRDEGSMFRERRRIMLCKIADVRNAISTIVSTPKSVVSQINSTELPHICGSWSGNQDVHYSAADTQGDTFPECCTTSRKENIEINKRLREAEELIENLTMEKKFLMEISQKKDRQLRQLIFTGTHRDGETGADQEKLLRDVASEAWRLVSNCGVASTDEVYIDLPSFHHPCSSVERDEQNSKLLYLLSCFNELQLKISHLNNVVKEAEDKCTSIYNFSRQVIDSFCSDRARDSLKLLLLVDQLEQLRNANLSVNTEGRHQSGEDVNAREDVHYGTKPAISGGDLVCNEEDNHPSRIGCSIDICGESWDAVRSINFIQRLTNEIVLSKVFTDTCDNNDELQLEALKADGRSLNESLSLLDKVVHALIFKKESFENVKTSVLSSNLINRVISSFDESTLNTSVNISEGIVSLLSKPGNRLTVDNLRCFDLDIHKTFYNVSCAIVTATVTDKPQQRRRLRLAALIHNMFDQTNLTFSVMTNATNTSLMTFWLIHSHKFVQLTPQFLSTVALFTAFEVAYCNDADFLRSKFIDAAYQVDTCNTSSMNGDELRDLQNVLKCDSMEYTLPLLCFHRLADSQSKDVVRERHDTELLVLKVIVHVAKHLCTILSGTTDSPQQFIMRWDKDIFPFLLALSYNGMKQAAVVSLVTERNTAYDLYWSQENIDSERGEKVLDPKTISSCFSTVQHVKEGRGNRSSSCNSSIEDSTALLSEILKLYKENQLYRSYIEQLVGATEVL